jgi:predicted RNase H-like HicB family nuclease
MIIAWSEPDQSFVLRVPELVGCTTHGDTYEEAVEQAKDVILAWIDGETAMGRPIPFPRTYETYAAGA